jgi:hypothetical protein
LAADHAAQECELVETRATALCSLLVERGGIKELIEILNMPDPDTGLATRQYQQLLCAQSLATLATTPRFAMKIVLGNGIEALTSAHVRFIKYYRKCGTQISISDQLKLAIVSTLGALLALMRHRNSGTALSAAVLQSVGECVSYNTVVEMLSASPRLTTQPYQKTSEEFISMAAVTPSYATALHSHSMRFYPCETTRITVQEDLNKRGSTSVSSAFSCFFACLLLSFVTRLFSPFIS